MPLLKQESKLNYLVITYYQFLIYTHKPRPTNESDARHSVGATFVNVSALYFCGSYAIQLRQFQYMSLLNLIYVRICSPGYMCWIIVFMCKHLFA